MAPKNFPFLSNSCALLFSPEDKIMSSVPLLLSFQEKKHGNEQC